MNTDDKIETMRRWSPVHRAIARGEQPDEQTVRDNADFWTDLNRAIMSAMGEGLMLGTSMAQRRPPEPPTTAAAFADEAKTWTGGGQ